MMRSGAGPQRTASTVRLHVLADVSHAFASVVRDYERLVETIVRTAADLVGDGCQMFLVSDEGMLISTGNAHRDPAVEADIKNFLAGPPQPLATSQMISAEVVRTGQSKLIPVIDPEAVTHRTDEAVKPLVARLQIHSVAIVPVRARDRVLGALSLIRTRPGHGYTQDDLVLLQDLANRAGLAIDNARLYDELERRVRQRTAELEAVNHELDAFGYSIAHDLRAPLRSIDGFSQALLEDCAEQLDDQGKKYLGYVRESAQRMAHLIDDLLALSRVTRSELKREKVDLSALASSVVSRLRQAHPERNVEVIIEEGMVANADAALLGIVLDNLIGNAWKFTGKCSAPRIELRTQMAGKEGLDSQVTFLIRDNGAGFDMAYVGKLFGVFQRLHSAKEFEGTGIGLATVQRIVRRHGGRVWAEAAVGQGATIHFTLEGANG